MNIMTTAAAASANQWPKNLAILGPEDVVVDRATHIAYVSSQDRRGSEPVLGGLLRQRAIKWDVRGAIYKLDLTDPDLRPGKMADDLPAGKGFHPTGIDLHVDADGSRRLFVVNWPSPNRYAIEVFEVEANLLRHVRTVEGKALTYPNDIAAVDADRFYVTNSLSWTPGLQSVEMLLGVPTGTVVYHDPTEAELHTVATGITYANGIALDRLRGRLYVVSLMAGRIIEFCWDPTRPTAPLQRRSTLSLGFQPDNLVWDDENTLWVAGSETWKSMSYLLQFSERAPSHVARIVLPAASLADQEPLSRVRPEAVYDDDGGEIPACSVAAPYEMKGERRFIVGSCMADHAIVCAARRAA